MANFFDEYDPPVTIQAASPNFFDQYDTEEQKPHSTATGLAKAFLTEAGPGTVAGTVGLPGDIETLGRMGLGWLAPKLGMQAPDPTPALPTSTDIRSKINTALEPYTGGLYEPKGIAEQYAGTLGSFSPALLGGGLSTAKPVAKKILDALRYWGGPAIASESAGQLTKGTSLEGPARMVAALGAPAITRRLITPSTSTAADQAAARILKSEGMKPTAGQITGNERLQGIEKTAGLGDEQNADFTKWALGKAGETTATDTSPATINGMHDNFKTKYDTLASQSSGMMDKPFGDALVKAEHDYFADTAPSLRVDRPSQIIKDIGDLAAKNNGVIDGRAYQSLASDLKSLARSTNNPELQNVYHDIVHAMNDMMERNNPALADQWRQVNREYRNFLPIERAASSEEAVKAGNQLNPSLMQRQITRTAKEKRDFANDRGDFAPVVRAGNRLLQPLSEGPPSKGIVKALMSAMAGVGGGAVGSHFGVEPGLSGGIAGMIAGEHAAPIVEALARPPVRAALTNRPAQAYLGNRALPPQPFLGDYAQMIALAKALNQSQVPQQRIRITPAGVPDTGPSVVGR